MDTAQQLQSGTKVPPGQFDDIAKFGSRWPIWFTLSLVATFGIFKFANHIGSAWYSVLGLYDAIALFLLAISLSINAVCILCSLLIHNSRIFSASGEFSRTPETPEDWQELKTWKAEGPSFLYRHLAPAFFFWKARNPALLWKARYEAILWGYAIWFGYVTVVMLSIAIHHSWIDLLPREAIAWAIVVTLAIIGSISFSVRIQTNWRKIGKRLLRHGDTDDIEIGDWIVTKEGLQAQVDAVANGRFTYKFGEANEWMQRRVIETKQASERARARTDAVQWTAILLVVAPLLLWIQFQSLLRPDEYPDFLQSELYRPLTWLLVGGIAFGLTSTLNILVRNFREEWLYFSGAQWIKGAKVLMAEPRHYGKEDVEAEGVHGGAAFVPADELAARMSGIRRDP